MSSEPNRPIVLFDDATHRNVLLPEEFSLREARSRRTST
jgi:hypothetical protein